MNKLLGKFLLWLSGTKAWQMFAKHWLGSFTFRVFDYPKFPMSEYFKVLQVFAEDPNAMYAFVCADTSSLEWIALNKIAKANWGHCGIVVTGEYGLYARHMKSSGLAYWHLLDILREVDNFALIKLDLKPEQLPIAQARLQSLVDAPRIGYDYQINIPQDIRDMLAKGTAFTPEEVPALLYCSAVLYMIGAGLIQAYTETETLGNLRFEPDAVFEAGEVKYQYNTHGLAKMTCQVKA